MTEELYISDWDGRNWERVDLGNSSGITLSYNSNLFGDLNQIKSNTSYTIKLPKTTNNCRIIDGAHVVSNNTQYPRSVHYAKYYRNGIEIIKKAIVYLMCITEDSIEIVLVWGILNSLEKMKSGNKKLTELTVSKVLTKHDKEGFVWSPDLFNPECYVEDIDNSKGGVISKLNFGASTEEKGVNIYHHPSARVSWLFQKIADEYMLTFDYPDSVKKFFQRLLVPCFGRKTEPIPNGESISTIRMYFHDDVVIYGIERGPGKKYLEINDGEITVNTACSVTLKDFNFRTNAQLYLEHDNGFIETMMYIENEDGLPCYDNYVQQFEVKEGGSFKIGLGRFENDSSLWGEGAFKIILTGVNVTVQDRYPIIVNLPDMKQTDFLISVCVMTGMFPTVGGDNVIKFNTLETLVENKAKCVDWSGKLVRASGYEHVPKELSFKLDDFAKENKLKYKEDDSVVGQYDGVISVEDENISSSRDLATIAFAASDTQNDMAYVPLYKVEIEKETSDGKTVYRNKVVYNDKIAPRILFEDNVGGESTATFKNLTFEKLIEMHYEEYKRIVKSPIRIKESFLLSDIDLRDLDYARPVYLSQYGAYFAIMHIQANNNGVSDCELLKI